MPEILVLFEVFVIEFDIMAGALSMRAVIYQPQYFPRLHYFARILNADIFSIADNVQFVRKHAYHKPDGSRPIGPSYQAHTPIRSKEGLLMLDYCTESGGFKSIAETEVRYTAHCDQTKHLRMIADQYRKAPQFKLVYPSLEAFFSIPRKTVGDMNIASIYWGLSMLFEVPESTVLQCLPQYGFRLSLAERSSESGVPLSDKSSGRDANDWLVDLCKKYGADEYYFGGSGAAAYMDFSKFERAGIRLREQSWSGASYRQCGEGFVANLSLIDLLMNVSPREARAILHSTD